MKCWRYPYGPLFAFALLSSIAGNALAGLLPENLILQDITSTIDDGGDSIAGGLGADTISVQFSGPRLIEAEAEDLNNWTLKDGTTVLPLAGR